MLQRPTLRRHLAAHVVDGEGVLLVASAERHLLTGPVFERLVPLLDGTRTAEELCDALPAHLPEEIYYALLQLEGTGALREGGERGAAPASTAAFWDALGVAPALAAQRLAEGTISVHAIGQAREVEVVDALAAMGLSVVEDGAIDVVLVDDYLRPELEAINARAMDRGRPWLLAKPLGEELWVGPWFAPGRGPCWTCLVHRLREHRPIETYLAGRWGAPPIAVAATAPTSVSLALGLVGHTLLRGIGSGARRMARIESYDSVRGRWRRHRVARRPQCPACGDRELYTRRAGRPPVLVSRPKRRAEGNDQRTATLGETFRAFRRHLGAPTGVVPALTTHRANGSLLIHAVSAGPNVALRYRGVDGLRHGLASTNVGKGATRLRARVSALGEALERYSGVFHGDEPRVRARMDDVEGAIHPNACMHFSARQYRDRDTINATAPRSDRIPPPFDPSEEVDWTPVWPLRGGRRAFLPTMLLFHDYPAPPERRTCLASTNGAASGNCLEEAILHGLLELIERDCVATWWYNRLSRPAADIDGLADRFVTRMRRAYAAIGREWWILDLTTDLAVPCYAAVSRRLVGGAEEPLFGFGAHLDPAIALRRAVTELNQIVVARDGENTPLTTQPSMVRWLAQASIAREPYLAPAAGSPMARASLATDDVLCDLERCLERLAARGLEAFVIDQSRPDLGVAVAHVVVPQLRNFRARYAPGRLYDTPVGLGWLPRPLTEDELNPVAFLL